MGGEGGEDAELANWGAQERLEGTSQSRGWIFAASQKLPFRALTSCLARIVPGLSRGRARHDDHMTRPMPSPEWILLSSLQERKTKKPWSA
jgi:hypothetical protein